MARRNKLLGLWAAERMGLSAESGEQYSNAVVRADFEQPGEEDVFRKIAGDFKGSGMTVPEEPLSRQDGRIGLHRPRPDPRRRLGSGRATGPFEVVTDIKRAAPVLERPFLPDDHRGRPPSGVRRARRARGNRYGIKTVSITWTMPFDWASSAWVMVEVPPLAWVMILGPVGTGRYPSANSPAPWSGSPYRRWLWPGPRCPQPSGVQVSTPVGLNLVRSALPAGAIRLSTVADGSFWKAALSGANTVYGPGPLRVSTRRRFGPR